MLKLYVQSALRIDIHVHTRCYDIAFGTPGRMQIMQSSAAKTCKSQIKQDLGVVLP